MLLPTTLVVRPPIGCGSFPISKAGQWLASSAQESVTSGSFRGISSFIAVVASIIDVGLAVTTGDAGLDTVASAEASASKFDGVAPSFPVVGTLGDGHTLVLKWSIALMMTTILLVEMTKAVVSTDSKSGNVRENTVLFILEHGPTPR
ncbi:hypothetical protein GUJ93_ZPchr0006g44260 [Zizania palustris]|uniref:Uncharacterized protein n=1 Tax=Zizania palustris TaxID=103762 RepID=A0A8J5W3X2_ZIZPA|nr:hypothetical protein GUJ93_ZPchr0006g44260 [Zizania palustris]